MLSGSGGLFEIPWELNAPWPETERAQSLRRGVLCARRDAQVSGIRCPVGACYETRVAKMTVHTGRHQSGLENSTTFSRHGPLRNITCRPYRLRRNCIRGGSSRQRRVGALPAVNDPHAASIWAFVSRSTSAYTLVVSIET